jgi:hypothetical protein
MNVAELRERLQSLLASDLGVYTGNIPSIWVFGSAQNPPSKSTGLECLIKQMPNGYAKSSSAGMKYKEQIWEITLVNYKQDSNLIKAVQKIENSFIVRQMTHQPFTSTEFERSRILIYDPIFITNT